MTQRDQSDTIDHGPAPEARGIGSCAIPGGRVRFMVAAPEFMLTDRGTPVAYAEMTVGDAVQVVQAIRQAINDARKGRVRPNVA